MINIRKYEEKDFDDMRYICLNSDGPDEVPEEPVASFLTTTYCDYYIEKEPENCFVLDSDGKAVGYVISAENYDRFIEVFKNEYAPKTKKFGEMRYEWALHSTDEQREVKDKYPAHLHINILPEFQKMGFGSKLIDTLIRHLKAKKVKGLCLTCGSYNKGAIEFYKKYGFELLDFDDKKEYLFGKEL